MLEHILREGFIHRSCHFSTNTRNGLTISGDETSSIHWWLLTLARNPHYKKLNNSLSHSLPLSDTSFTHTHTHTLSLHALAFLQCKCFAHARTKLYHTNFFCYINHSLVSPLSSQITRSKTSDTWERRYYIPWEKGSFVRVYLWAWVHLGTGKT